MKKNYYDYFLYLMVFLLLLAKPANLEAQQCDNLALDFDGNEDYISLNTSSTSLNGDAIFTVEAWFEIKSPATTCNLNFRRLFSLSGPSSRFEVGECNNQLRLYWENITSGISPGGVVVIPPVISPGCHHLAVVRKTNSVQFFLDGSLTPIYSGPFTGMLNTTLFRVGHWGGGPTPLQDWQGTVDEIRLWNSARTPAEISDFKDCSLSGPWPALIANWTLDQSGIFINSPPNTGAVVEDMNGNNDGVFSTGFMLSGTSSNFICYPCPAAYQLDITDFPAALPISLASICEGDYAHFCVSGITSPLPSGSMVMWESTDGILPFALDPDLINYVNAQNALCFPVQQGKITANCANSSTGVVNRKYRAVIKKKIGLLECIYKTDYRDLQICCPITNAQINYVVQPPTQYNGTICEGTATVDVSLSSTHPYLVPLSASGNVTIQWCIDGVHDSNFDNLLSFTYNGPANWPDLCFEAKILNCGCPLFTTSVCIPVDRNPQCGLIDQISGLNPTGLPWAYDICPYNAAVVAMNNPLDFKFCNPVWQYHFDTDAAGVWYNMLGASNPNQNTNILPQYSPPNAFNSPYLWPVPPAVPIAANCIYYRVACQPLTQPNSGCTNCTSNVVEICLKKEPPTPVITSTASQICFNSSATLSIPPVPGAVSYTWYCNGEIIGTGPSFTSLTTMNGACYWVEIFDGCFTLTTQQFCLEVCIIVSEIACPTDNPCACDGLPITLIGCNSGDSCSGTGPLTFSWVADGIPVAGTGCQLIHTPKPTGSDYSLTVCNSLSPTPCCSTSTLRIEPCI